MVSSPQLIWGTRQVRQGMGSVLRTEEYVFCSTDAGQTFQQKSLNGSVDVWGLDALTAWAIAGARLWATTSGPAGLVQVATAPTANLRFVRFANATNGLLVGQPVAGATSWPLFYTRDGGATWTSAPAPAPSAGDLARSCTQVGNSYWVSTVLGNVLRSTDGGQSWTSADTGLGSSLREVAFRDALHGLAFGTAGQLRRSTDGGQTWTAITPQGPLRRTTAVAIEGSAGTYLSGTSDVTDLASNGTSISNDDGATWYSLESSTVSQRLAAKGANSVYSGGINLVYRYSGPLAAKAKAQAATALGYPNPANDVLYLPASPPASTAQLYDMTGRLQRTWQLGTGENSLRLHGIGAGVYQLRVVAQDQPVRVQQLVVQH
ncbi:T9SS type A sorting domain-containing protein [Hymenobacter tibetensis]|uniref:T9SS type A sorting domain-containing protein n=1 Tax=Hymenobacter tibetensis TaxID=497967 RepID=A0ABY4D1M9_9BACT|nr:T9SS type A sorting domain-containing protein [Hymenobacter tibetensis]UOG76280.1 T9SS type A sorting domain-containing protein [Hymenobacter tibetensis]